MNTRDIKPDLIVKTVSAFEENATVGMWVAEKNIKNRKPDCIGRVLEYVPGHGGDVWWINHKDNSVAPYCLNEFFETEDKG